MKRFEFRYQAVLQTKASFEDAQKAVLGEAMVAQSRAQHQLDNMQQTRVQCLQAAKGHVPARLELVLLELNAAYLQRLENEIAAQQQQVVQAETIVADRRVKLVEARRQRRVYEILRDQAWQQHQQESRRWQQLQLDEAGERLHARKSREAVGGGYQETEDEY